MTRSGSEQINEYRAIFSLPYIDSSRNPCPALIPEKISSGEIAGSGSLAQSGIMSGFGWFATASMYSSNVRFRFRSGSSVFRAVSSPPASPSSYYSSLYPHTLAGY